MLIKKPNLKDEVFETANQNINININITFYRCNNVTICPLQTPVDGIKLVHCANVHIEIQIPLDNDGKDKLTVLEIYAFYCDICTITLPKNYQGNKFLEVHGCMIFDIVRRLE